MELIPTLRIALRALQRNRMRSALTVLGIVIGVGAVIAMIGVGQGASQQMQQQIAAIGTNLLFIAAGSHQAGAVRMGWGQTSTLVYDDERAILREIRTVKQAAAGAVTRQQVIYGNNNWGTSINGTEPVYFTIRDWPFASGTAFTRETVTGANNVAVLGNTVVQNLFPNENPIGKTIRIGNLPFKVVGTLVAKGQSAAMGSDQDDVVFVPFTTVQKKITGQDWLQYIVVSAISQQATGTAQEQITELLHERHRIPPGQPDDFIVRNLADVADVASAAGRIMTLLLGSIASVSLLVGGIGIMNIMLVSVTERTREIGIRLAVGATEQEIRRQFLLEAITLSLVGGAVGILVGLSASWLIAALAQWPVSISPVSIVVAVLFSVAVGVFFGWYPARKASALNPIEALRYE
jgi:putative ABC transport system permease protein